MVYIGHGADPDDGSQMPPSNDKAAGRLLFLNHVCSGMFNTGMQLGAAVVQQQAPNITKRYDDLLDFQPKAGKTLFICQACYSGEVIKKMTESKCTIVYISVLID